MFFITMPLCPLMHTFMEYKQLKMRMGFLTCINEWSLADKDSRVVSTIAIFGRASMTQRRVTTFLFV